MPEKPKTPSSRLTYWSKEVTQGNPFRSFIDFNDEAAWTRAARTALDLDSCFNEKWNRPVRKAFNDFGLDPRDPYHWRLLITLYVGAHAGRGRPPEWNSESLCNLLRKISEARAIRPNANQSEIYRSLTKPKAAYSGKTVDYLKHGHRLALNLDRNEILCKARDLVASGYVDVVRVSYQEKGRTVTASDESRIKESESVLDEALKLIGAPRGRWIKK
jgi:hypothetical protein